MEKIERLKLTPIFEAVAITDGSVNMVSTGSTLSINKDGGSSALILENSMGSARYNKIENEDLELPVLQNELAGLVGDFDNNVHKLFAKYGYQWAGEQKETAPVEESKVNEDHDSDEYGGSPTGTWIGDFLVTDSIIIGKLVDAAIESYSWYDQNVEDKFRRVVSDLMKEEFNDINGVEGVSAFIEEHQDELKEFAEYYAG